MLDEGLLSPYDVGSKGGEERVKLKPVEMPKHSHNATTVNPSEQSRGIGDDGPEVLEKNEAATRAIIGGSYLRLPNRNHTHLLNIQPSGGNKHHNNMPPYIALYFCKMD